jgi:hypothetical protein
MVALGRTLFVVHVVFLLLAATFIAGSFGGFLGGISAIISAALAMVSWGGFAGFTVKAMILANGVANGGGSTDALRWARNLFTAATILSPLTGLGLAFLAFTGCGPLWLPSLYHWGGMIGTILGFAGFFLLPALVRACVGSTDKYADFLHPLWLLFPGLLALTWGLVWLVPYLLLKDHVTLTDYAAATKFKSLTTSTDNHLLPFPGGESSWVIQGNNTGVDHNDSHFGQKFSWDFVRRCGTPVLVSRGGKIAQFTDNFDGFGIGDPNNNQIVVQSGTAFEFYLHIQQGSVPAPFRTVGTPVKQGDEIAKVGCVGNSLTGHIHFMVRPVLSSSSPKTVAVVFSDVSDDNGIPRTFSSYTSGNRAVP